MIAEVGRIIGPNSHAINANRENSSVSSIVNALLKMWRACFLCLFLGWVTNVAEFTATDSCVPSMGRRP